MGLFGGGNKVVKTFQSNNKLVEVINNTENSKILSTLEDEIEKRYLYRNVEKIGCIINGVDRRNFYQCHFLIKKS